MKVRACSGKNKIIYILSAALIIAAVAVVSFMLGRLSGSGERSTTAAYASSAEAADAAGADDAAVSESGTLEYAQREQQTQEETAQKGTAQKESTAKETEEKDTEQAGKAQAEPTATGTANEKNSGENSSENSVLNTGENTNKNTDENSGKTDLRSNKSQALASEGDSPYSLHGRLFVSGTQLTDEYGSPFQLRGVSTHGIGWFPQYVNEDTFSELRNWGANAVRIAMYTGEGGYCQTDEAGRDRLLQIVDTGVQAATALGMYVIIDWHILSDGNPNTYADMAVEFFDEVSGKYGNYGNVLYEICNEPNGGVSWDEIKRYAERIIPVIREHSEDAIIIVGTPTWSQDVDVAAANPVKGYDNIMYTLHFYADTHRESLRNKLTAALNAGLPVMVTEFGICDASGSGSNNITEGNTWIDMLDAYGISYFAWNLSNKGEASALIANGNSKLYGFEDSDLSESGRWYKGILSSRADGSVSPITSFSAGTGSTGGDGQTTQGQTTQGQTTQEQTTQGQAAQEQTTQQAQVSQADSGNCSAVCEYVNGWQSDVQSYGQYSVSVSNTSSETIEKWTVEIRFASDIEVTQSWNCSVTVSGSTVTVTPQDYNSTVQPGSQQRDIGLIVSGSDVGVLCVEVR